MTTALVALALGLAAVGVAIGSSSTNLKLATDGGFGFTKKTLVAKAGKVTIVLHVVSGALPDPHNIAIKRHGVNVKGRVIYAGTSTVTATLKHGVYEFYCSVPGHEAAGMKGTLIIK